MKNNSIKAIKSSTKRINELLANYKAMSEAQLKTRNVTTYNATSEQMKYDFNMIIEEMNKMLNELDELGFYCGALSLNEFNRIEKKTLFPKFK